MPTTSYSKNLPEKKLAGMSTALRANILGYYKGRKAPPAAVSKKDAAEWAKVLDDRRQLEESAGAAGGL